MFDQQTSLPGVSGSSAAGSREAPVRNKLSHRAGKRSRTADEIHKKSVLKRTMVYEYVLSKPGAILKDIQAAVRAKGEGGVDLSAIIAIRKGIELKIPKEKLLENPVQALQDASKAEKVPPPPLAVEGKKEPQGKKKLSPAKKAAATRKRVRKPQERISKPLTGTRLPKTMQETIESLTDQVRAFSPAGATVRIDIPETGPATLDFGYQGHIRRTI